MTATDKMPLPRVLVLDIDGVLTDGTVAVGGAAERRLHLRDLDALARARAAGIEVAFLTGETEDDVEDVVQRCGGGLAFYNAKEKERGLQDLVTRLGVAVEDVCFVGDARRDSEALAIAGVGLVPADADPHAKRAAARILSSRGGAGAVAEAVDLLLAERAAVVPRAPLAGIRDRAASVAEVLRQFLASHIAEVEQLAALMAESIKGGGCVLFFGNGGSAAMAQHAATELIGRFRDERGPFRAMALTSDTAVVTAVANDWSFDEVFSRQIVAHGRPGDVAVGLSTSGASINVLSALAVARERGLRTALLTGDGPSHETALRCDLCLRVPSCDTARVQELHLLALHLACEHVDEVCLDSAAPARPGQTPSARPGSGGTP